jgi:ABC-type proline/glycine betaine transport system ATPase subunit
MLNGKTRILCTHAIDFLHLADKVIVLKKGEIVVQGSYSEVKDHPSVKEVTDIHDRNAKAKEEAFKPKDSKSEFWNFNAF